MTIKKLSFVFAVIIFVLFSCKPGSDDKKSIDENLNEDIMVYDSLPDAKWNGEYLKIEDDESSKKITRKSLGSEYYNMGDVSINIGDEKIKFDIFEKKKNVMTFTEDKINAFIKSAFDEDVHIGFRKNNIIKNYKGKYKSGSVETENNTAFVSIKLNNEKQNKEYEMISGIVEIINFNPRLGNLEFEIDGYFLNSEQQKEKGTGIINMRFEHAIMTID